MSPEQASGKLVDKRADTWPFGVVLFEMLSGRRACDGETVSRVLAAVLNTDPDRFDGGGLQRFLSSSDRLDLDPVLHRGDVQCGLEDKPYTHRFGVPEYVCPPSGTLGAHRLSTCLDLGEPIELRRIAKLRARLTEQADEQPRPSDHGYRSPLQARRVGRPAHPRKR